MKKIYKVSLLLFCFIWVKMWGQCLTPSVIPCYEPFSGITINNQLPPCWAVSDVNTCITFTNLPPGKMAAFYYSPAGDNYFYTRAIQLQAGITYSAGAWYMTATSGSTWTDFALLVGASQSTTGLVQFASVNAAISNTVFSNLGGVFTVLTSGIYYLAIKGTSNGAPASPYLYWDDLRIEIPCTPAYNNPSITITPSSTIACDGMPLTFTASGANTYTWSNGQSGFSGTITPNIANPVIYVTGSSTLSGCNATKNLTLTVFPTPFISANAASTQICQGDSSKLSVNGNAVTYSWSTGQQGTVIPVYPNTTTSYTVMGTNSFGCVSSSGITIYVNALPVISISTSTTGVCAGEEAFLNANGAMVYQWASPQSTISGNSFVHVALASTIFTITGTEISTNCTGQTTFLLNVDACTGLSESTRPDQHRIYPNPSTGIFSLELGSHQYKSIEVIDMVGRTVFKTVQPEEKKIEIDLSLLPEGIYQVQLSSGDRAEHLKIVKQNTK
jgi:hypothetical protein